MEIFPEIEIAKFAVAAAIISVNAIASGSGVATTKP